MLDAAAYITVSERLPVETYDWGTLQWLCNAKLLPGAAQTVGICHLFAGKQNPAHYHPNCEEVLHLLAGKGRHRLGDQWIDLPAGSTIRIPIGMVHQLVNDGNKTLVSVIAFSSGDRQTVFLE